MELDEEALEAAFEEALPRNDIISKYTVAAIVETYLRHILQGAEERVARAIAKEIVDQDFADDLPENWDYSLAWLDQGRTEFLPVARAALSALLTPEQKP